MDLEVKKIQEFVIVKPLNKSIDSTVSTDFKDKFLQLIEQGNTLIVLNLSRVEFIDSGGLVALISVLKALTVNGGDIIFCELKEPVKNLLTLTRMNKVFRICSSEKESLEQLAKTKKTTQ